MVLKAKAYAKINLFLDIIGKRSDGYHELDSVFQSVDLYDEVTLSLKDKGISVVCDNEELSGDNNIVFKACELFFDCVNYNGGVQIEIKKNIPIAAGLAGGSADAAATLLLLNETLQSKLSVDKLCQLGEMLGADVPFCILGGTARVNGIGEKMLPIKAGKLHYVLMKEREKQSTGKMFALIDNIESKHSFSIEDLICGLKNSDLNLITKNLYNAFSLCWDFDAMVQPFIEFLPKGMFLSGSGPTVCAVFENEKDAVYCARELIQNGHNAFYASSVTAGVEFV